MTSTARESSVVVMNPRSSDDRPGKFNTDALSPHGILATIEAIMVLASVAAAIRRNAIFGDVLIAGPASASSAESVGEFWFGQVAKCMI